MGKKSFPEKLKNFFSLNGSLNTSKGTQTRVAVAKIAFSAVMVLLVGHMAILQFVRGEELQEEAITFTTEERPYLRQEEIYTTETEHPWR